MATRISEVLDASLDYLVGKTKVQFDHKTLERIQEVSKMDPTDQGHVSSLIDAFIAKTRLKGLV